MRNFTSVNDVENLPELLSEALQLKNNPYTDSGLGKNRTIGLIFLNPSLRTRLSTQKAAANLGMNVIVLNIDKEGWALETQDGIIMNHNTVEHIKEAAPVLGQYCDIIGLRAFPRLVDKKEDYSEDILHKFIKYSGVPLLSLESSTLHPLQSFTDLITIEEYRKKNPVFAKRRPKVVLTWAPHIKALPQAVPNSFAEWMTKGDVEFVISHPHGYELDKKYTKDTPIIYDQDEALKDADFIYVKNWSSYTDYGKVLCVDNGWMMTNKKLELTNQGKVMHCLPVRRGIELADEILDSDHSIVIQQAGNRVWACQAVLKKLLKDNFR